MPTYQYACTECDNAFEQFQSFTDDALTECPKCEGRLRKIFNAVGVVFKGSGFYRTDSRTDGKSASSTSTAKSSDDSSSSSTSKPEKKSESSTAASTSTTTSGSGSTSAARDNRSSAPACRGGCGQPTTRVGGTS